MSDERFHVRMEGDRPIRLTVAEMTPDEALAAVERGPLQPEGIAKLDQLWANDFFVNA